MLRLLKALLRPADPAAAWVHFHVDADGHRVPCDDSLCRPATRLRYPDRAPYLLPR
jgi:hypothetical protein